jgi:hypothetical protein
MHFNLEQACTKKFTLERAVKAQVGKKRYSCTNSHHPHWRGWEVNATARPLYPWERDPVPSCTGGWTGNGVGVDGYKNSRPQRSLNTGGDACFGVHLLPVELLHIILIPLAWAEWEDSLPFSVVSSIPLCYIHFPATLLNQLLFHPPLLHLAVYFFIYLLVLLIPNSYTRKYSFGNSIFCHSLYMS